jgi:hypothetical protein
MIVGCDSGGFKFARFHGTDFAERHAYFRAELAHFPNNLQHALKFFRTIAHAAPGCAHAKSGRAL